MTRRGRELRPCGLQETAILCGYKPETAWRWNSQHSLPRPDHRLSGNPMWLDVATIEAWAAQEGKLQGALERWARQLGHMVRVEGRDEVVPDPEFRFAQLYDELRLGEPETDLRKIKLPAHDRRRNAA
jgi:predicted DNA-binding transcriptional regulator AlpA